MTLVAPNTLDDVKSAAIRDAADRAVAAGNAVQSVARWSKALVVHMRGELTPALKAEIEAAHPGLRWYADDGSPHLDPDCGWTDDGYSISFPRKRD